MPSVNDDNIAIIGGLMGFQAPFIVLGADAERTLLVGTPPDFTNEQDLETYVDFMCNVQGALVSTVDNLLSRVPDEHRAAAFLMMQAKVGGRVRYIDWRGQEI